jgi:hypothetical protein
MESAFAQFRANMAADRLRVQTHEQRLTMEDTEGQHEDSETQFSQDG